MTTTDTDTYPVTPSYLYTVPRLMRIVWGFTIHSYILLIIQGSDLASERFSSSNKNPSWIHLT
jgi:hypothetical protein